MALYLDVMAETAQMQHHTYAGVKATSAAIHSHHQTVGTQEADNPQTTCL